VESWIAVNPDSELIPVARANGIGYFEAVPQGGIVSGQSGLVAVDGWTMEQRTFKKPLALHFFWPSMDLNLAQRERSRAPEKGKAKTPPEQAKERRTKIRAAADFFDEARAYAKARDAEGKAGATAPQLVPAWEAMLPFIKGDLPITIHADDIRQIRSAVEWAATNHFKIILAGARDAWMAADLLATNKIPVIYSHVFTLPPRDSSSYDVQFTAAEVLHKAGVQVAFSFGTNSFDAPLARNLPYCAAQAVAFGLPEAEAIKGITLYPAQIAGVADRLGSIAPGKEATLFAADGDILDIRSTVKRMWVSGKEIPLETRHTRLYDKYKNRPVP
jgi:imidazolonepropionase-like amidohydrolase